MQYWLMKSEPDAYSIDDLERDRTTLWDGVRNYQARNFLRTAAVGDQVFFYHSNTKPPGIVGLMQVIETNIDDPTQFDANSKYYDPKSTPADPRWQTVRVEFAKRFPTAITLDQLKEKFEPNELQVVKRGNRLSVVPVEADVAQRILALNVGRQC